MLPGKEDTEVKVFYDRNSGLYWTAKGEFLGTAEDALQWSAEQKGRPK